MGQDTKTATTGEAAEDRSASGARQPAAANAAAKGHGAKVQGKDRDMGFALRSVYQKTVEEPVPDDLLDLLGKLG